MKLFLIRHAQSANNARPDHLRVADPTLTEIGFQQAGCLAERVRSLRLTRLVTSPFLRALLTTEPIRQATGLRPEVRTGLHEQGGCYSGHDATERVGQPGMSRREIEQQFPGYEIDAPINDDGWWQCRPYESHADARQRARRLLENTRREFGHTSERIAFVMHGDFKCLFLQQFHADELEAPRNASVTKMTLTPSELRLDYFNETAHLPTRLLST